MGPERLERSCPQGVADLQSASVSLPSTTPRWAATSLPFWCYERFTFIGTFSFSDSPECGCGELNPDFDLGKVTCDHYTTPALQCPEKESNLRFEFTKLAAFH